MGAPGEDQVFGGQRMMSAKSDVELERRRRVSLALQTGMRLVFWVKG